MKYEFNPLKYGFEPASNYPELAYCLPKRDDSCFVKVVCYSDFDGLVYWYKTIYKSTGLSGDDRFSIYSGSHDFRNTVTNDFQNGNRLEYKGIISSHEYAELLLINLLSELRNDSILGVGIERFFEYDSVGHKMRDEYPEHYQKIKSA